MWRAAGSISVAAAPSETYANCSVTMKRKGSPVTMMGAPKPSPVRRRAEAWKRLSAPMSRANCFGKDWREAGHSRVPEPLQKSTGWINVMSCSVVKRVKAHFLRNLASRWIDPDHDRSARMGQALVPYVEKSVAIESPPHHGPPYLLALVRAHLRVPRTWAHYSEPARNRQRPIPH